MYNLLFFAKDPIRREDIRKIALQVVGKFPAKILLIGIDPEEKSHQLQVNSLGVEISISREQQAYLPLLILPHLAPDLPLYVIWEDPSEDNPPLLQLLRQLAAKFIVDGEACSSPVGFAHHLLSLDAEIPVTDLTWSKLHDWRALFISLFQREERTKEPIQLQSVAIYSTPSLNQRRSTQSLYLQNWLATQLEWIPMQSRRISPNQIKIDYSAKEGPVEVCQITVDDPKVEPGSILSFHFHTKGEETFLLHRSIKTPRLITATKTSADRCDLPIQYLFRKEDATSSLIRELAPSKRSTHYPNMLHHLWTHQEVLII